MAACDRILARGMPGALKTSGEATRTVVIELNNLEAAAKCNIGDGYQTALVVLDGGPIREFRYIETG